MGFFSWLSGSDKAMNIAEKGADGLLAGLDHLNFSDEEKHDANIQAISLVVERAKLAISETSVRSMTRRLVALTFCIPFVLMSLFAVAIYHWNKELADFALGVANSWKYIMIAIVIWFFGSYGVGYIIDKKKEGNNEKI